LNKIYLVKEKKPNAGEIEIQIPHRLIFMGSCLCIKPNIMVARSIEVEIIQILGKGEEKVMS
jgi:hypothetical protein